MAKYWDKLNLKMGSVVHSRARIAAEVHEDYIEGVVLQSTLLEALLRIYITTLTGSRKRTHKKYWDGDAKFSQLIIYCELLGGKREVVKLLNKYNVSRNKIIHATLRFVSMTALIEEAKSTYNLGTQIDRKLLRVTGFKVPRDFYKPLPMRKQIISTDVKSTGK